MLLYGLMIVSKYIITQASHVSRFVALACILFCAIEFTSELSHWLLLSRIVKRIAMETNSLEL